MLFSFLFLLNFRSFLCCDLRGLSRGGRFRSCLLFFFLSVAVIVRLLYRDFLCNNLPIVLLHLLINNYDRLFLFGDRLLFGFCWLLLGYLG